MPGARALAVAIVVAPIAAAASSAAANPIEIFGFGSRHGAHAGAGVAAVDDMAATWMNPAGLAAGRRTITTGGLGAISNLRIDDRRTPLAESAGGLFGLTLPAPLGGPLAGRIGLGVGMFILPDSIARISARFPDEPFYPYYQGRTERLVIVPGLGVRITEAIAVGVAANVLAGLGGGIEAGEGATRALEARVDETVPTVARLILGATWAVRDELGSAWWRGSASRCRSRPSPRPRSRASRSIWICRRAGSSRRTSSRSARRGRRAAVRCTSISATRGGRRIPDRSSR